MFVWRYNIKNTHWDVPIPYGHPTYQVLVILVVHIAFMEKKQKSLLWLHSGDCLFK